MNAKPITTLNPSADVSAMVTAELQRLVNDETWDEVGQDRVFMEWAQRISDKRILDSWWWVKASEDVPFTMSAGDRVEFKRLILEGDECSLGKMIRDATIREFANDVFNSTDDAWTMGVEP